MRQTDIAFTYQGRLNRLGTPLNGTADFKFALYDAASGGTQVGPTLTLTNATVSGGLITVDLNFGAGVFAGQGRFLDVQVRSPSAGVSPTPLFSPLTPRQPITPTPYALLALNGNPGPQGATGATGATGPTGPTGAGAGRCDWCGGRDGSCGSCGCDGSAG